MSHSPVLFEALEPRLLLNGALPGATINNFDDPGTPYTLQQHGDAPGADVAGGVLRLTHSGVGGQLNSIVFDRAALGPFEIVTAEFEFRLHLGTGVWSDGAGFLLLPTDTYGTSGGVAEMGVMSEEPNVAGALGVGFDIYDNSGRDINDNHASLHWNGARLAEVDLNSFGLDLEGPTWISATVTVTKAMDGSYVTVTLVKGATTATPFTDYFVPGLDPFEYRVGLSARSGGGPIQAELDNVLVQNSLLPPMPPVAADDTYVVEVDGTLNVAAPGVLDNDYDVNDDAFTADLVSDVSNGALALTADGSFTYTPNAAFEGTDTFTYRAYDGGLYSDPATVTLYVGDITDGLAAHWTFDDGSGTTAADSSGNGNDGMLVNGPTWAGGIEGGGLDCDGVDDYVEIGTGSSVNAMTTQVTLSAWVQTTASASEIVIFGKRTDHDTANDYVADITAKMLRITMGDNAAWAKVETVALDTFDDGRWHLATWVIDTALPVATDRVKVFVDGERVTSMSVYNAPTQDANIPLRAAIPLTIGARMVESYWRFFDGLIDDARIYDRALTEVEVQVLAEAPPVAEGDAYAVEIDGSLNVAAPGVLDNDYDVNDDAITADLVSDVSNGTLALNADGSFTHTPNATWTGTDSFTYRAYDGSEYSDPATVTIAVTSLTDGLVAHWMFDEGTGTTAADSSGNGNDGTLVNGPVWVDGIEGGALDFDGDDDYVDCGDVLNDVAFPFSVSTWFRRRGAGDRWLFHSDDGGQYAGFWLLVNDNGQMELAYGDGSGTGSGDYRSKQSTTAIGPERWAHVAAVADSVGDITVYIDGEDAGGTYYGSTTSMAHDAGPARAAMRTLWGPTYADGTLDDLRVYDRALTGEEVAALADVPRISIDDVTLAEGDAGTTNAVFTVTLSEPSDQVVTVDYATAAGTAAASVDYWPTTGTLTFQPGETEQTIAVPVVGDLVNETDETFTVNLTNDENAIIDDGTGLGTIQNDDAPAGVDLTCAVLGRKLPVFVQAGHKKNGKLKKVRVTLTNTGNRTIDSVVTVRLYASLNDTLEPGADALLGTITKRIKLKAGKKKTLKFKKLVVPALAAGNWNLLVHGDATNAVAETDEDNNVGISPQTVEWRA